MSKKNMYTKIFTAKLEYLNEMLDFIMGILDRFQTQESCKKKIYIISEEVLTNIIKHAYNATGLKQIERIVLVEIFKKSDLDLLIIFQDKGVEYEFDKIKKGNLKENSNAGIGVFLIKNFADFVQYKRDKGTNKLEILMKNVY